MGGCYMTKDEIIKKIIKILEDADFQSLRKIYQLIEAFFD